MDHQNIPIDPDIEALNVSNWVTDFGLRNVDFDGALNDPDNIDLEPGELGDPDNFRLEVTDPTATGNKVSVGLRVRRPGLSLPLTFYELAEKQGDTFRSQFIRLVSDTVDAIKGKQTILVELGDTLVLNYLPAQGGIVEEKITVGRPVSENNNGSNQKRHDIRELRVNIVVFQNATSTGPAASRSEVEDDIRLANERLAQSTIRLKVAKIDMGVDGMGVVAPGLSIYTESPAIQVTQPSEDEKRIVLFKDGDPNSIDVFYVNFIASNAPGRAYFPSHNLTGDRAFQNFVVLHNPALRPTEPFVLAHELMHILLNRGHRGDGQPGGQPDDPVTALFNVVTGQGNVVGAMKRIGPNFDAEKVGIGNTDTTMIRGAAEDLPN